MDERKTQPDFICNPASGSYRGLVVAAELLLFLWTLLAGLLCGAVRGNKSSKTALLS